MAGKSFDYSKWDKIELSDDESDLHPNIDKDSWFRLKHRTRLEREEKEDKEIKAYQVKNGEDQAQLNKLRAKIMGLEQGKMVEDAEFEDIEALKIEATELQTNISERNKRIAEITERRKWNIDNICKVTEEKTIVNSIHAKPLKSEIIEDDETVDVEENVTIVKGADEQSGMPENVFKMSSQESSDTTNTTQTKPVAKNETVGPALPVINKKREKMVAMSYNEYAIKNEHLLEKYSEIEDLETTKEFLFKNCDVLLHEHSQSYLLLSCLEDEMNGKKKRMKLVARQSQILTHINELGVSLKRDPRDVILPFFKRIEEKAYLEGFLSAVNDFILRIQKRAVEKRKEMEMEAQANGEGMDGKPVLGPGGLDPAEVMEKLPKELKDAFESQNIEKLQDVITKMDPKEAKYWMKQCVDSGLWVPKNSEMFEEDAEEESEMIEKDTLDPI